MCERCSSFVTNLMTATIQVSAGLKDCLLQEVTVSPV